MNSDAVLMFQLPEKEKPRVLRNSAEVEPDTEFMVLLDGGDIIKKGVTIK